MKKNTISTDIGLGEFMFTSGIIVFLYIEIPELMIPITIFFVLDKIKIV